MNDRSEVARTPSTERSATQPDSRASTMVPPVDVFENQSSITLMADMPGVPKDNLVLQVNGDSLLIEGSAEPATPENLEPLWAEVRVPRYRRAFTLSRELDSTRIEANLKDGVLTLTIPKQEHAQPRRIEVNAV
jgi:HSP20 family molecular chaperone IbpA